MTFSAQRHSDNRSSKLDFWILSTYQNCSMLIPSQMEMNLKTIITNIKSLCCQNDDVFNSSSMIVTFLLPLGHVVKLCLERSR